MACDLRNRLGVSHINPAYGFGDQDCLNEGAERLLELGTGVIKVILREDPAECYRFGTRWAPIRSLTDLARSEHFRDLFAKPFSTFILMAFAPGRPISWFLDGVSEEDLRSEQQSLYDFASYLLAEYAGSGKTFVIQNWESDWVLTPPAGPTTPEPTRDLQEALVERMAAWCAARQAGVERARAETAASDVTVLHALEVNLIERAMKGHRCAVNALVPLTNCDLYSYSSWETQRDPVLFREALSFLREHAPASEACGRDNIYVGEYGAPENEVGGPEEQERLIRVATDVALDWGARFVVYWQLYCNEPARPFEGHPTNRDMRGFWLIRPDGSRSRVWDLYRQYLR